MFCVSSHNIPDSILKQRRTPFVLLTMAIGKPCKERTNLYNSGRVGASQNGTIREAISLERCIENRDRTYPIFSSCISYILQNHFVVVNCNIAVGWSDGEFLTLCNLKTMFFRFVLYQRRHKLFQMLVQNLILCHRCVRYQQIL